MCRWKDEFRKRIYKKNEMTSRCAKVVGFKPVFSGLFLWLVWCLAQRRARQEISAASITAISHPGGTRWAQRFSTSVSRPHAFLPFVYHPCKSQQSCSSRPLISSDFLDPTMCLWQDSLWLKSMGESRLGRGSQPDHSGAKGVLCCAVELKEFSVLVWPWGGRTVGDEIVSPPSLLEANTIPIRASQTQDSGLSFSVSAPFGWRWSLSSPAFGICVLLCVILKSSFRKSVTFSGCSGRDTDCPSKQSLV